MLAGTLVVGGAHCAGQPWSRWGSAHAGALEVAGAHCTPAALCGWLSGVLARGSVLDEAPPKSVHVVAVVISTCVCSVARLPLTIVTSRLEQWEVVDTGIIIKRRA